MAEQHLDISEVDETFYRSLTEAWQPPTGKERCTSALLDPSALKAVFAPDFGPGLSMNTLYRTITPSDCKVHYSFGKPLDIYTTERVIIELTHCRDARTAEDKMKNYLKSFKAPLSAVTQRADIGKYSLHTYWGVFWVRDTIFAKVYADHFSISSNKKKSAVESFNAVLESLLAILETDTSSCPIQSTMIDVARTIDKYLAEYSVSPEQQIRPSVKLCTPNPMTVSAGQPFLIELEGPHNLHEAGPAEIEDWNLIIQVAYDPASGQYEFFALKAGETKIKIGLAHTRSLAVACISVNVTVIP